MIFRRFFPKPALLLVFCAPILLFQALYFNAFVPITEDWFSEYAHLIRAGAIPYVDFHLPLPPLFSLQIAAFQAMFGEHLIALHVVALMLTCCIGIALFLLLRMIFNDWVAAFSSVVGLLYYQSSNVFVGYDFHHFRLIDRIDHENGIAIAVYARQKNGK